MKLLRLSPRVTSTSAPYNQFSLGFKKTIDQILCSFLRHDVLIDENIKVFHGNGSIVKMLKIIKELVKKNKFDVIHIHSGLMGVIFIFAIFPSRLGLLKKTVFTLHNSWHVIKTRNQILNFFVMLLSRKVCTCGLSSRDSIPKSINYFIGGKTEPIVNGFDHNRIDRVEKNKGKSNHFQKFSKIKILYVGALNKTKNQMALLEVLKIINIEAELIFLGDGVNKKTLIEYSKNITNSTKISFKGLVSRDLAIEHMIEADVCISLSKGEGLPIAVLEAMYAGCFMILSTIPPHLEVSPPSDRCFFVDISNKDEIIESLNYVMNNLKKNRIGREKSKEYAISKFGVGNMLDGYKKVYKSICQDEN